MDPVEERSDVLEQRLGSDRARSVADELGAAGLVAIDAGQLAELERQAAGYRRLARLVEQPDS